MGRRTFGQTPGSALAAEDGTTGDVAVGDVAVGNGTVEDTPGEEGVTEDAATGALAPLPCLPSRGRTGLLLPGVLPGP